MQLDTSPYKEIPHQNWTGLRGYGQIEQIVIVLNQIKIEMPVAELIRQDENVRIIDTGGRSEPLLK